MKKITQNKKAYFEYFIEQTFVAGIKLQGSEVKSIRAGKVSINEAHITFKNGEVFILNMHIAKFDASSIFNHDETRTRKLLLNRHEINKIMGAQTRDGITVIPLSVELHGGLVKLVIALAKGKKLYDKRETIKERDLKREQQQALKGKR
ncbi:MAG TPA: SsrA-binding protein SmpB [Acholeplasmataceae bacterium]|nr:SsrA-binding protein SmpB [Acholeplasmataceae bacterium]